MGRQVIMVRTFNIISSLLDYPSDELKDSLDEGMASIDEEGILNESQTALLEQFVVYAKAFASLRDWQSAYSDLFDNQAKTNLYLFDFVYGTSKDRGQAMVDLQEEYLRAGLIPREGELPDYLPMFLQYVANQESTTEALKVLHDIQGVLEKMQGMFAKQEHPYEPLIHLLLTLSKE